MGSTGAVGGRLSFIIHISRASERASRERRWEELMKLFRRKFLHLAAGAAALPAVSRIVWAQTYPTRPITMIVPFAAGGPTDVLGRVLAERMGGALGQTVIV